MTFIQASQHVTCAATSIPWKWMRMVCASSVASQRNHYAPNCEILTSSRSQEDSLAEKNNTQDDDREQWDQAWSSQRHYCINTPLKIDVGKALSGDTLSLGKTISVTISEDPSAFSDRGLRPFDDCPLCGQPTKGMNRIAASLHPEFENGIRNISIRVWAHKECIEMCPMIDGPAPIPW
jgi:hypothetical protein